MVRKVTNLVAVVLTAVLFGAFMAPSAFAHSIDYIATDIQPQAIFSGQSGHFQLIDPIAPRGHHHIQSHLGIDIIRGRRDLSTPGNSNIRC